MRLWINGESRELPQGATVAAAVREMGIDDSRGVAVAVEGEVVPAREWDTVTLSEGGKVEVLRAVQGGSL